MSKSSEKVKDWRKNTKQRIIDCFGSRCGCCGYSKCQDALELHHLNPSDKEFSLGAIRANPKSWEKVVIELRKCVLLCAICHREVHAGLREIPENCEKFNENFSDYKANKRKSLVNNCPVCGKEKSCHTKTCSLICGRSLRSTIEWEKYDLYDMIVNQKLSKTKIGKIIGCSDVAVTKRLKRLNINL